MIEKAVPPVFVSAHPEARFFAPVRRSAAWARSRFFVCLVVVLAVHAALLGWFLYRDSTTPDIVAAPVETPIEIVQEPAPEPQKPEAQKPEPEKPQEEASEKPATSAPRAASPVPVDTKAHDAKDEARKTSAPPRDGQAEEAAQTPAAEQVAPGPNKAADAKLPDDKTAAEALDRAKPDVVVAAQDRNAKPKAPEAEAKTARQLSGLSELPSYSFAASTPMAEFPAGNEDNRYLAVVYAKVMSKNRYPASAAARRGARGRVSVSFVIDFRGRVAYQAVSQSSGQADLDALAMMAVHAAAPFPFPPGSGSQRLIATMSFGPQS